MALPQLVCHNFFFPILAMQLPQLVCHNFPPYFGNAIATATISLSQIFFSPISVMALPQLVCHNFVFPYFSNGIATNQLQNFL